MNWQNKLIVVAEDEDTNYTLLEQIIKETGAEILRFEDGLSLVNYYNSLETHNTSLILMDIKMPGLDGIEALKCVRQRFPDMVVIAQSAYAMKEDIELYKDTGFNNYLTKPISPIHLKELLNQYLMS
ncbi:MAG: response regulator [Bacteroidales bacterium]|nr:response regulator [Bacteroidales bacterium]